jgi:hypothetical protein
MLKRFGLLLATAALAACHTTPDTGLAGGGYRSTDQIVQSLGYDTIALPSTGYGPGSLVTSVKGYGFTQPLRLAYLCRPEYANAPPAIIDTGATSEASRSFNGSFNLSVAAIKALGLGAQASNIESITLKFSDVKVEQLPYADLKTIQNGLGPVCAETLKEFKAKGLARQTQQALRADVTYTAHLKRGVSAEVKNLVIQALQASFGGSVDKTSDTSVTGTGLYYGLLLTKV